MEAQRTALQLALLQVQGRGSAGLQGAGDAAGDDGVGTALARGSLPSGGPCGMLAHCLPALPAALEASRAKAATTTFSAGRGCSLTAVPHIPAKEQWEVQLTGVRRVVLAALAAFLYADVVVAEPAHRLLQLKQLAGRRQQEGGCPSVGSGVTTGACAAAPATKSGRPETGSPAFAAARLQRASHFRPPRSVSTQAARRVHTAAGTTAELVSCRQRSAALHVRSSPR